MLNRRNLKHCIPCTCLLDVTVACVLVTERRGSWQVDTSLLDVMGALVGMYMGVLVGMYRCKERHANNCM